jgi:peptidoglycan/LPS O-acetylase OafA/YrhL
MAAEWGSFNKPTADFFLLPTRVFEIIIGALVAFYLNSMTSVKSSIQDSLIVRQWVSLAGLGLIIYAVFVFDKQTPFPSLFTLVPTVGAALIILFSTSQTIVGKVLASKLFVGIGLISYSAYLWHQPILAFARISYGNEITRTWIFLAIFATFFIAFLSWRYVEFPFRKRNFIPRKSLLVFVLLCSTFLFVGHCFVCKTCQWMMERLLIIYGEQLVHCLLHFSCHL